jgi:peptidoglycan/LPS O-acetylase OafA/YrhL
MLSSPSTRREFDIDFFRGWVCLSLMFLHFYNSHLYLSFHRLFGDTGDYLIWNWRLGVESFFVLAGFMMAHMLRPVPGEDVSLFGYVKRRFFRLILPYWIAVAIFTCYRWGARLVLHAEAAPSLSDVASQLFLMQEFFVAPEQLERVVPVGYWSMVSLEQFYLLWLGFYGVCLFVFGRNKGAGYAWAERAMCFLTFVACLGSLSFWVWHDVNVPGTAFGWGLSHDHFTMHLGEKKIALELPLYTVFLSLGMLLYWSMRQKIVRHYFWIALVLLLAAACETNFSRLWKALFAAIVFIPLAHGMRLPNNKVFRFLTYVGRRSYSIYLIHPIAGICFIAVTWRLTSKSDWLAIPIALIAMIVSILAAFVFYKYVELPCQAKSRTVEYRKKRTAVAETSKPVVEPQPV